MARFPTTLVIVIVAAAGAVAGWLLFWPSESNRFHAVSAVRRQRSEIHLAQTKTYARGPIAREELRLDNNDGRSSASYAIEDRKGTVAKFTEPMTGYDVTFAFDLLVRDGIWELHTPNPKTFRGKTDVIYDVSIAQLAGERRGGHHFGFADPHWLATNAGRQYEIHLDPGKAVPSQSDLLRLQSTSTADPRYEKIVADFASFGPPRFRKTVAAARAKLLRS